MLDREKCVDITECTKWIKMDGSKKDEWMTY